MSVQLGAMTLPFRGYSYERALDGVAAAGFGYVCIGLPHEGRAAPHHDDDPAAFGDAADLARKRGLEPIMFFCLTPAHHEGGEADWVRAVDRAAAADIPYVLSMGTCSYLPGFAGKRPYAEQVADEQRWLEVMRHIGGEAHGQGVTILVKPHTGNTATAFECRHTVEAVGSSALAVCYDPGNVRFYEGVDPIADLPLVAHRVKATCLKDHRGPRFHQDFPPPGEGAINYAMIFNILAGAGFSGPMMIERVDGTEDAAKMPFDDIVRRLTRVRERMTAAITDAGLKLD